MRLMAPDPEKFKEKVQESLRRQTEAINRHTKKGTYFFDYGNAFLLEASRAGAKIYKDEEGQFCKWRFEAGEEKDFAYPSYVQDIMGPMCFDYGFGPFRWVCASGKEEDLDKDRCHCHGSASEIKANAPEEIQQQMQDNIKWIEGARANKLVVGSQARILYADAQGQNRNCKSF